MSSVVVDTHALVWYVEGSTFLSARALAAMHAAVASGEPILFSSVSLVEIAYLAEKGKLPPTLFDRIIQLIRQPGSGLQPTNFTFEMANSLRSISRVDVPDMPDRMIAATALALGLPLVTKDSRIRQTGIPTIW